MKIYRFPDTKPWKSLVAVLLLALLLLSRDTLYAMAVGITKSIVLSAGLLLLLGLAFLAANRHRWIELIRDKRLALALVSCVVFLLPMAVKGDWQLMYVSVLMCVLGGILVSFFLPLEELAKFYVLTMTVLGAYSVLAAYVLRIPADMGLIRYPIYFNAIGNDFYVPLLSFVSIDYVAMRNFGIFREPGVYQFFVLLAVYLTFYQVSWKRERSMWICCVILCVTLLTTMATGGIAELCMMALVVFLDKKYYKNKFLRALAIAVIAGGIAAVAYSVATQSFLYDILEEIFGKLFYNGVSVTERIGAIGLNIQLFLDSPLVGAKLRDVLHGTENNTSSTTILFAMLGILGGAYHLAGWVALIWQKKQRWLPQLLLLIILLLSCNTCNIMWNIWFWMIPTVALCQKALPLIKSKTK